MTVQNTTRRNVYMGNGSTTNFPITFPFSKKEDIFVYIAGDTGISEATTNFDVDVANSRVVYPKTGEPLPVGKKITLMRTVDLLQLLNLVNQGPFWAEDIEGALDYLTFIVQQLADDVSRCILLDVSEEGGGRVLVLPRAPGMAFKWNEDATGLVLFEPAAEMQSDWNVNDVHSPSYIRNKPTIGNGTLTLKDAGGVVIGTFNANATGNKEIVIPSSQEPDFDGHLYNASEKWTDVGTGVDYSITIDLAKGRCQDTGAMFITLPAVPAGCATVLTLHCSAAYLEFEGNVKWPGGEAPEGTGDLLVTFYGINGYWYGMPVDFAG